MTQTKEQRRVSHSISYKKYCASHRKEVNARARKWRASHREHVDAYQKIYTAAHVAEKREYNKAYRAAHLEACLTKNRTYYNDHKEELCRDKVENRKAFRLAALAHYGGKCAFCGDTNTNHLAIDHVDDDGAEHRKITHNEYVYAWLSRNNYPEGFQILCANHNAEKQLYKTMTPTTY